MEIRVDASTQDGPTLVASRDFKAFKVVVTGDGGQHLRRELGPLGSWVDGDHVAVSVDALRRMAGDEALAPEWQQGFDGMLGYAESKGWMIGNAIQAHVEWES